MYNPIDIGIDSSLIRTGFWSKSWNIPKLGYNICGYSKAAHRTGFYIKDLDLLLDAGPQNFNHPRHIMITHVHDDHIAELALTLIPESSQSIPPIVYAVESAKEYLDIITHKKPYVFKGITVNNDFMCNMNKKSILVHPVKCEHGVNIDTISFCFSEIKQKLKLEYRDLKGHEIKKLKDDKIQITEPINKPLFAFICDTSINIFTDHPEILQYPVIFIECTFLYDGEQMNAVKTNHIHWDHIKPIIIQNPNIIFMLFHFSMRYKDDKTIRDFFITQNIDNVYCWA
uniref:Metallo-beta-lactamase domain-containing protein n=1 Tax=viral metagenome TaxID=1070528 RepID=A0A6C0JAM6_9ZZZZ